jgi:hypothetical protein
MKYVFIDESKIVQEDTSGTFPCIVDGFLRLFSRLIPPTNPDFLTEEDRIRASWLEVDEEGNILREIGWDEDTEPVFLAPIGRNVGIWVISPVRLAEGWKNDKLIEDAFEKVWAYLEERYWEEHPRDRPRRPG